MANVPGGKKMIPGAESGLITRWLVKLVVFLALGGLVVIEIGGILFSRGSASSAAQASAGEAAFVLRAAGGETVVEAQSEAVRVAKEKGSELIAFSVDQAGQTVRVTVERKATTVLVHRIEPLKKYSIATATHSSSYQNR